mmetsp:Transcript_25677/g.55785  ORF Transcript_25677/g.55785 Transcript_25677/m.55785 type:complete len:87 (-) Transcript_25677:212-472(-)
MVVTASFSFPGNVEKSITVMKSEGPLSKTVETLKAECMSYLGEYLESQNIDIAEADKDDAFEETVSDADEPTKTPCEEKKQKTKLT